MNQGHKLGNCQRLHIKSTTPNYEAITNLPIKGRYRPESGICRYHIEVIEQDHWAACSISTQPRPDTPTTWGRLENPIFDILTLKNLTKEAGCPQLISWWIGGVNPQVFDKQFNALVDFCRPSDGRLSTDQNCWPDDKRLEKADTQRTHFSKSAWPELTPELMPGLKIDSHNLLSV